MTGHAEPMVVRPVPFATQPVRRGRPRKDAPGSKPMFDA
jgi:hypothetical protein